MAKKLTKPELEEDPFLSASAKVQNYYEENKNLIIGSGAVVILIIALALGYHYYNRSQERKAEQLMGNAEEYLLNGDYEKAMNGSEADFTVGFTQVINNYSGTEAGNLAEYYAAVCAYNLGNTQQALNYIENYETPEGILGVGPLSLHATILNEVGNHQQAAEMYVEAAEWDKNDSTTPYNFLEAAQAYKAAKKNDQARKYAEKITADYPNSSQVSAAQRLIGLLAAANK